MNEKRNPLRVLCRSRGRKGTRIQPSTFVRTVLYPVDGILKEQGRLAQVGSLIFHLFFYIL